jgi:SAM-dependent methyltransferase
MKKAADPADGTGNPATKQRAMDSETRHDQALRDVWEQNWAQVDLDLALRDVLKGDDASSNTRAHRPEIDRVLNAYSAPVVLESGCGAGQWLYYVVERTPGTAIGLDIAADSLTRVAATPLLADHLKTGRVQLVEGDMRKTPLADESVDVVLSFGVIEHVLSADSQRAVNEFARVLKKNGRALITTPNPYSMHSITRPILQALGKWTVGFERSISPKGLCRYVRNAGLEVERYGVLDSGSLFGAALSSRLPVLERLSHSIERSQRLFGFLAYCVARKPA